MEFNLSEDQNLLIDTTKSFVKAELLQHEELLKKTNNLPKELYDEIKKKSIEAGLYACNMPIEHGGGGLNAFDLTLVKKHLGFASLALAEIAWRPQNILIAFEGDGTNHSLDPNNDDYYDHEIEHCPDIKDSVFLTPTSNNPYSPFEVLCLPKDKWEVTNKKLEGDPEGCFYSRNDVYVDWKDSIGIFKH